jgi:hypothetical protein
VADRMGATVRQIPLGVVDRMAPMIATVDRVATVVQGGTADVADRVAPVFRERRAGMADREASVVRVERVVLEDESGRTDESSGGLECLLWPKISHLSSYLAHTGGCAG